MSWLMAGRIANEPKDPPFLSGSDEGDELWTEDGVFYDPNKGVYRGRDEIERVAGAIRATHPDFRYEPIGAPEEVGNGGRVQWVAGRPGEATAYAGTDFLIAREGRIAALYLFFDKLP